MSRIRKYLNLTDTEIDDVIDKFAEVIKIADSDIFIDYIKTYHEADYNERDYDAEAVVTFCTHVYDFVYKKREKLRVKTDLKLNKDNLFASIFENVEFELSDDIRFWLSILFNFCFSKYELYDHLDEMEDSYRAMYEKYLSTYDINNVEITDEMKHDLIN